MSLLSVLKRFAIWSVVLILISCADQQAFVKGKSFLEQGKLYEGFAHLKEAVDKNPGNLEYKSYYYRQREQWIARLLRGADSARINYRWNEALDKYDQVLEIDPSNDRAVDGIKAVRIGKLNADLLNQASDFIKDDDLENANDKVRMVLASDVGNNQARKLLSQIEQKKAADKAPAALVNSKFKKAVTLEFKDANIKTVFELLSKAAGINFILDKEIRPDSRVSIFVTQTTIESALQNILSSSQLSKKILNEKSVLIYPNTKKSEFEEKLARTFYLNSVDVKQVQSLIKTVVKTKDIFIDEKLNILVMHDSQEAIRLAEKLINAYDVGDPEVLLEVEILEISTNKLSELGARWPSQVSVGVAGAAGNGQLTFDEARGFNSGFGRISITDPALILNLRGSDSSSKLLANPHIRVKNHKKAKVLIGDRVPVITNTSTSTGFVAESVSYLDVGLKLNVEPTILINDEVSIDIGLEVSNIVSEVTSKNGTLTYRLGTRDASTSLRLKDGETQVLAGLINDEERSSAERVPGLASIPVIGRFFSSNKDARNKTEIVLLITPRIVRNIAPTEYANLEFSTGTETGNGLSSMPSDTTTGVVYQQPAILNMNPEEAAPKANLDVLAPNPVPVPESLIPPPPPLPGQPALQPPPTP